MLNKLSLHIKKDAIIFVFDIQELYKIYDSHPNRGDFGVGSTYPYICFHLEEMASDLMTWLCDLPCPVIGVGRNISDNMKNACDVILEDCKDLLLLDHNIRQAPFASMILVQVLRLSENMTLTDALMVESFAYSTVQLGTEFRTWLKHHRHQRISLQVSQANPLLIEQCDGLYQIVLNTPETRNVIDVNMRDLLCEALELAFLNSEVKTIRLSANGACFSIGSDINEFGYMSDSAMSHWIRTLRLPAWWLIRLNKSFHVHIQGAAIGSAVEMSGFADYVTACEKAWFHLPELKYGLIPGAGGTVGLARRMGRQRLAYMVLSRRRISAKRALEWGLIDCILS